MGLGATLLNHIPACRSEFCSTAGASYTRQPEIWEIAFDETLFFLCISDSFSVNEGCSSFWIMHFRKMSRGYLE